jgi:hypothetical protein
MSPDGGSGARVAPRGFVPPRLGNARGSRIARPSYHGISSSRSTSVCDSSPDPNVSSLTLSPSRFARSLSRSRSRLSAPCSLGLSRRTAGAHEMGHGGAAHVLRSSLSCAALAATGVSPRSGYSRSTRRLSHDGTTMIRRPNGRRTTVRPLSREGTHAAHSLGLAPRGVSADRIDAVDVASCEVRDSRSPIERRAPVCAAKSSDVTVRAAPAL